MDASDLYAIEIRQHHHETYANTFVRARGLGTYLDDPALDELAETAIRKAMSYGAGIVARLAATIASRCDQDVTVVTDPSARHGYRLVGRRVPWTISTSDLVQPHEGDAMPECEIEHPREDAEQVRQVVEDVLAAIADSEARITTEEYATWCHRCRNPERAEVDPDGRCRGCRWPVVSAEPAPVEEEHHQHGYRTPGEPVPAVVPGAGESGVEESSVDLDLSEYRGREETETTTP